ncbi:uncharacterized protein LOC62_06G007992 [Vanrija pseudolonga]|uniref:Uncharacterized protein n=1 Tax=Vanrija pseudolonga TaxID=143232 RepID=A0AAF0YJ36_9TREE|nr:hypothetical protein LOC62_06G007992 [Vanrija pseudolonga]
MPAACCEMRAVRHGSRAMRHNCGGGDCGWPTLRRGAKSQEQRSTRRRFTLSFFYSLSPSCPLPTHCTMLTLATALALLSSAAALTVNSPASLVQCQPVQLSWSAGTPPYYPAVIPAGQPSAQALVTFPQQDTTVATWVVNLEAGTNVTIKLTDGTGATVFSAASVVQKGTSTACLTASPSAGGASNTGGSGSATGTAAPSGSGAASGAASGSASASASASAKPSSGDKIAVPALAAVAVAALAAAL